MVDHRLIPAITTTIRQNEIGNGSPYVLSFAKFGKSGASFGFMQGDTNVSNLAQNTLLQAMTSSGVDPVTATRIVKSLSRPLPDGNPLSAEDTSIVNGALISKAGEQEVDKMDETLLAEVLSEMDLFVSATASIEILVEPVVNLYVGAWINMTGPPTLLNKWVKGAAVHGVPPPVESVTENDISAYLQASSYFSAHPRNFRHLHACVMLGAALLPQQD